MDRKVHDLLKKINYIEADIEIQKQILFSIPSKETDEMERILGIIASQKEEINTLRGQIHELSPETHEKITMLEQAISAFKKIASEKQFATVEVAQADQDCLLTLKDNSRIQCLVKACDHQGKWTVITLDGEIKQFAKDQVNNNT